MTKWLLAAFSCALALGVRAQRPDKRAALPPELRDLIEQRVEAIAEQLGDNSDVDLTVITEQLLSRYQDPIDLNRTTADELATLQLLTDAQIAAILDHIRVFGPFINFYELQTIDQLDLRTLELIRPFVTVSGNENATRASLKEILRNGSSEVLIRSVVNVEQRRGFMGGSNIFGTEYTDPDGTPLPDLSDAEVMDSLRLNNKVYLGSPYKLYTRYRFKYRNNVDFGITAEKDEGEQFFNGTQPDGFDFYSAHLFLRNIGPVKALALGDYQAQFGQGLVFWNGITYASKSAFTLNVKRNGPGLLPYTSVNENLFLRGAGATVDVTKHLEGTAFFSHKYYDGNTSTLADTSGSLSGQEAIFSSFQEDGYHRTYNELAKKDAIEETIYGGHLRYKRPTWSIGATAAHVGFGNTLVRAVKPYNQFEFQGKENTTYGADWNVLYHNLTWFGEAAQNVDGGTAALTGLLVALDKRLSLAMLYRDYARDYHGLYSVAFSESSTPWNERGLYTGLELRPTGKWTINAYLDQFQFPWLRYQTDALSRGYDWLLQATWTPNKKVQLYARARYQNKPRNSPEDLTGVSPLVDVEQRNYRFNASYKVSEAVTLRTRIERVDYQRGSDPVEHGFLIYQDASYRPMRSPWEFTGRLAMFSSGTYNARIYAYENDVIGLFSIPAYYGRGLRYYAMVRWTPVRRVDVWLRYGAWIYNGQDRTGSGLDESDGARKSDVKLEVRVKF